MHPSDDELLDLIYGVGRQIEHVEHCEPCRERLEALTLRRRKWLDQPEASGAWLDAQRTRLKERLENASVPWPRRTLRPAAAMAALTILAVLLTYQAGRPVAIVASGDAQLLNEIYTLIQEDEPRASSPVRALFEERQ
jgi:hypothetical protein